MSESKKQIREALLEGATQGLSGDPLYRFVREQCPDAKATKIVHAAFLALSDPDLKDRNILDVIYALALQYRLQPEGVGPPDGGTDAKHAAKRQKLRSSKAASLPLPEGSGKKTGRK